MRFLFPLALIALLTGCTPDAFTPIPAAPDDWLAEVAADEQVATKLLNDHLAAITSADKNHRITLAAGSQNGLAAALAQVANRGTITLEAGDHFQAGTVVVDRSVNIIGAPGARLIVSGTNPLGGAATLEPALHINDAAFVRVRNLELVPAGGQGGTAILVQDAPYAFISRVVARDWQNGVVGEQAEKLYVERSTFVGSSQWQTDPTFPVFGVVVINGPRASLFHNNISNTVFGIWACDERGRLGYNQLSGNVNGIELCKVPVSFPLPDGQVVGSDKAAGNWLVYRNNCSNNFNSGFEVIDGANQCLLLSNVAENNMAQDYEFAGATSRYGFPAPTSEGNRAFLKPNSTWKDCGAANRIRGGVELEDAPCF